MKRLLLLLFVLIVLVSIACSPAVDTPAEPQSTYNFHRAINARDFEMMMAALSPDASNAVRNPMAVERFLQQVDDWDVQITWEFVARRPREEGGQYVFYVVSLEGTLEDGTPRDGSYWEVFILDDDGLIVEFH